MIADHCIKYSFRRSVLFHPNDMAEPVKPLDINTLSNVHVIEELIQLPVGSDTVDIIIIGQGLVRILSCGARKPEQT